MFHNLRLLRADKVSIVLGIVAFLLFVGLELWIIDVPTLLGNLGPFFTYSEIILHLLISVLFGLFVSLQVYKIRCSGIGDGKSIWGAIGGLLGVFTSGCPACAISLASLLGLGAFLSFLPWYGLELKIISVLLLVYVDYTFLKNLTVCRRK